VTGACCAACRDSVQWTDGGGASWFGRDDFIINPTYAEIEAGDLDLVVAGSPEGVI